jgi:Nitrate reductase delta subunit
MIAPPRSAVPGYELLRALGAVADSPAAAAGACHALGLADPGPAAHTEVFVLNCPPYAAVYLGEAGGLGGEASDRVAGFWRAAGFTPPAEPDHLTALLSLYAGLGESAQEAGRASTAGALDRARRALFHEHLWPWLPGYLDAVSDLGIPALTAWAALAMRAVQAEHAALARETAGRAAGPLPLALRSAPPPTAAGCDLSDLLTTLITPVRSGFILTRRRLAAGAEAAGVGYRIGERRFSLRAMLEQSPAENLGWLAGEARRWQRRHAARAPGDPVYRWWAQRAQRTARMLTAAAELAHRLPDGTDQPAAPG